MITFQEVTKNARFWRAWLLVMLVFCIAVGLATAGRVPQARAATAPSSELRSGGISTLGCAQPHQSLRWCGKVVSNYLIPSSSRAAKDALQHAKQECALQNDPRLGISCWKNSPGVATPCPKQYNYARRCDAFFWTFDSDPVNRKPWTLFTNSYFYQVWSHNKLTQVGPFNFWQTHRNQCGPPTCA